MLEIWITLRVHKDIQTCHTLTVPTCVVGAGDLVLVPQHRLGGVQRHRVDDLCLKPPPLERRQQHLPQEGLVRCPRVAVSHQPAERYGGSAPGRLHCTNSAALTSRLAAPLPQLSPHTLGTRQAGQRPAVIAHSTITANTPAVPLAQTSSFAAATPARLPPQQQLLLPSALKA
jgi:hypothetical protein